MWVMILKRKNKMAYNRNQISLSMPFMWVMILKLRNTNLLTHNKLDPFNALYVGDDFETLHLTSRNSKTSNTFNALYVGDDFETHFIILHTPVTITLSMPFMWVMILKRQGDIE